jgi:hypothetical protein
MAYRSHQFFQSLSNLPPRLSVTSIFGTARNPELEISAVSLETAVGAVGSGAFVAVIATVGMVFPLHRKHSRSQTEKQIGDELNLSTEHRNGEYDVDEHFFDLQNGGTDSEYLTGSQSREDEGGGDLRVHFYGEQSFPFQ